MKRWEEEVVICHMRKRKWNGLTLVRSTDLRKELQDVQLQTRTEESEKLKAVERLRKKDIEMTKQNDQLAKATAQVCLSAYE